MITVILTIHTLIVLALIGVVLLQRSEGGALGMGGGGGGFMTGRGAANVLTRTTSVLAALFFSTSVALAIFASRSETQSSVLDELTGANQPAAPSTAIPGPATTDDLLKSLGAEPDTQNPAPDAAVAPGAATDAPAETAPASETETPAEETPPPSENPGE